ncbi:MAG TPA: hypothetical protein VGH13_16930 [Xanthobacteraceae bacterium]
MPHEPPAEPPSRLRKPLFIVGQNSQGNWVVQDQKGICGGLFVNRKAALSFVRAQQRFRPYAVIVVSDLLELDIKSIQRARPARKAENRLQQRHRVA